MLAEKCADMLLGREALAQEERTLSSTRRELLGAERTLRLFVGPLPEQQAGGELIFLIDNQGAAEGLEMGSPTPALQTIIERCRDHCDRWGVELAPAWARRSTPEVAICDFQGKRRDDQAWQLAPSLFRIIDHEAGFGGRMGHEVDMFADDLTEFDESREIVQSLIEEYRSGPGSGVGTGVGVELGLRGAGEGALNLKPQT